MKKIILLAIVGSALSSCTISYRYSLTNNPIGSKSGVAEQKMMGNIPLGDQTQDASFGTAAKNGGISKIGLTETVTKSYVFFRKTTTTVYGE